MPALRKPELFNLFEEALREGGWNLLKRTTPGEHPAGYYVFKGSEKFRVRLYIWNLTPGGRVTIPDEWRIQITGLPEPSGSQQFMPEIGGKTLVMGKRCAVPTFLKAR